jgi:hypothetical protein
MGPNCQVRALDVEQIGSADRNRSISCRLPQWSTCRGGGSPQPAPTDGGGRDLQSTLCRNDALWAITGQFADRDVCNHRSVRNGTPLDSRHPTIGTEMRKAGYAPLLFGYTDTSIDPMHRHPNDPDLKTCEGLAPGFAEIICKWVDENSSWLGSLKGKGYQLPKDY